MATPAQTKYWESMKGKPSGVKGRHWKIKDTSQMGHTYSKEEKKKASERAKKLGFGKWMLGKKLSEETRKNKVKVIVVKNLLAGRGAYTYMERKTIIKDK